MNQRTAKYLRKKSYELAAEWLKTMLPQESHKDVTPASVRAFEADQERHVHANGRTVVSAYSSRFFYLRLKKALKKRVRPTFQVNVKELG